MNICIQLRASWERLKTSENIWEHLWNIWKHLWNIWKHPWNIWNHLVWFIMNHIDKEDVLSWLLFSIFSMFSIFSKLSPYSPILDCRVPPFMEPRLQMVFNIFCKKYSGIVACHPLKGYLGRGQCVTVQKNAPKVQKTGLHTHGSTLNYATIIKFIHFWLVSLAISLMEWIWKITITWPFYEWRLSDVIKTWINLNIV